jgi:hypothetical protein
MFRGGGGGGKLKKIFSQVCRAFLILSSIFIYPTNAQLDCSKRMLKLALILALKVLLHVSISTTIIREFAICALLKL